ncbi:chorismate synthase [candidate division KSB1 bacterium]|nr:chorismate synthase [candidate division KSB1 bacterium]RQW03817.1 MAG: chorismate synthase [candidate division KSB1 bacterium]
MRFLTAGESHGRALVTIVEGVPAGLPLSEEYIAAQLERRQRGYGRGGRMKIERDRARILTGIRYGRTLGSPISLLLDNKDWPNWTHKMSVTAVEDPVDKLQMPRPGHADFAGMVKYRTDDLRDILERSSARETAMRVAAGAIARRLLAEFQIKIWGHVVRIGSAATDFSASSFTRQAPQRELETFFSRAEKSPVACADRVAEEKMIALIDQGKEKGESLGGLFEVVATGCPVGLGSHVHWDRKLDAHIAAAMMSINAIKSVEIGLGRDVAHLFGSQVHDEIFYDETKGFHRIRNHAGGIEGGMSNGEPIVARLAMKPLPTMSTPLRSVDLATKQAREAHYERADVCAVPAAVVVAEAMLAIVLANALIDKIGGDSLSEMQEHFKGLPNAPMEW